jgi:hypothetical protein
MGFGFQAIVVVIFIVAAFALQGAIACTVSAFVAWELTPAIARRQHGFITSFGGQFQAICISGRIFAEEHPDALRQIVRVSLHACATTPFVFVMLITSHDSDPKMKVQGCALGADDFIR